MATWLFEADVKFSALQGNFTIKFPDGVSMEISPGTITGSKQGIIGWVIYAEKDTRPVGVGEFENLADGIREMLRRT